MDVFYQRFLPHWQPEGVDLFVTWRLYGSLPRALREERAPGREEMDGRRFVEIDRVLDRGEHGPKWLGTPAAASVIAETLLAGEHQQGLYRLRAWSVMPNHVHALWSPLRPMPAIMQWVKGTSARRINRMLGREGQAFWQHESYDRWVRGEREAERIVRYIERNPVAAGLVERVEDWEWSSAWEGRGDAALRAVMTG
jgi:REP element-mobilizing transposase RayT